MAAEVSRGATLERSGSHLEWHPLALHSRVQLGPDSLGPDPNLTHMVPKGRLSLLLIKSKWQGDKPYQIKGRVLLMKLKGPIKGVE